MILVGPTHTRGDTGIFVEGDGVLFAGDVVMNDSFVAANQALSVKAWLAAFDAFEAMKPRTGTESRGAVSRRNSGHGSERAPGNASDLGAGQRRGGRRPRRLCGSAVDFVGRTL
jgi:hypothetical protein